MSQKRILLTIDECSFSYKYQTGFQDSHSTGTIVSLSLDANICVKMKQSMFDKWQQSW